MGQRCRNDKQAGAYLLNLNNTTDEMIWSPEVGTHLRSTFQHLGETRRSFTLKPGTQTEVKKLHNLL